MKNFILIIIFSFILSSCSIKEEAEKTAITELEGIWKTSCYVDSSDNFSHIKTITVSGTVASYKDEGHSDTSCATDYSLEEETLTFSIVDAVTFANGKTGHKFTVTVGSTEKITPQSASAVSALNSESKCSASDWELNTEKECSNDDAGDTNLCLYQLDGNNWYPECNESSYPTSVSTSDTSSTFVKQ